MRFVQASMQVCVELAPSMRRLAVRSLALQSDQCANTLWPWEQLTVETLDMAQVLRLPKPSSEGVICVVEFSRLEVGAGVQQVRARDPCLHAGTR